MSGKIIEFRERDVRRVCRQEPAPGARADQADLKLQIARITLLLEEIEGLTRSDAAGAGLDATDDDPQPEVDSALLERMYRDLNSCA